MAISNEELVQLIQSGVDVQANTEALWKQNTGIVHKLAASYARDQFEAEDLAQEGFFALVKAAEKYDPDCGAKFITYFIIHLNARMRRYLSRSRSPVSMPYNLADSIVKYHRSRKDLQMKLNADPSDKDLCRYMGITMKKLQEIKKAVNDTEAISLDDIQTDNDETMYRKIPDPQDRIESLLDDIALQQLFDHLWKMVDGLEPREQMVIKETYLKNKTCTEIGKDYGVSNQRINQIKQRALTKLRSQPGGHELMTMAQDIYGIAVKGTSFGAFQRTWTSATERAALFIIDREEQFERENFQKK